MRPVSLQVVRARVKATHGPQFLLPARFEGAAFDTFAPDPRYPSQAEALARLRAVAESAPPRPARWAWWRSGSGSPNGAPRAVYLDGPPGIGKTHLLAAAFHAAAEPKLFATFDEFSAAAGTLRMKRLSRLLAAQDLVCIDEIDLRDPANIMLLVSLLRAMLASRTRILATANVDPTGVATGWFPLDDLRRELGEIADAFAIVRLDGVDHRPSLAPEATRRASRRDPRTLRLTWEELVAFLFETHPMYDAAWLREVDLIEVDRFAALSDNDQALRFVRFVDRVYDRDVALRVRVQAPPLDDFLAALASDRRFVLHAARCRSRLVELVYGESAVPGGA